MIYYLRKEDVLTFASERDIIILAPSMYWYSHANFPTKSLSKARKLAESLLAERPKSYKDIIVAKTADGYDCYALNLGTIKQHTFYKPDIPILFLQQFFPSTPFSIGEETLANRLGKMVLETPSSPQETDNLPSLDQLVSRHQPHSLVTSDSSALSKRNLTIFLVLLVAMFSTTILSKLQVFRAYQSELTQMQTDRSIYEIKAMVKAYERSTAEQFKLRKELYDILQSHTLSKITCDKTGCQYE